MRYITIILCAMLLGSCGKLNGLKYAGKKVNNTINECSQSISASCPGVSGSSVNTDEQQAKEGIDTKASTSWDTHMMLW